MQYSYLLFLLTLAFQLTFGQSIIVEEYSSPEVFHQSLAAETTHKLAIVERLLGDNKSELQFYNSVGTLVNTVPLSKDFPRESVFFAPNRQHIIVETPVIPQAIDKQTPYTPEKYKSKVYDNNGNTIAEFEDRWQAWRFFNDSIYISVDANWENDTNQNTFFTALGQPYKTIEGVGVGYVRSQSRGLMICRTLLAELTAINVSGDVIWSKNVFYPYQVSTSQDKKTCVGIRNEILLLDSLGNVSDEIQVGSGVGNTWASISEDSRYIFWAHAQAIQDPQIKTNSGKCGLYDINLRQNTWIVDFKELSSEPINWVPYQVGFLSGTNLAYVQFAKLGLFVLNKNGEKISDLLPVPEARIETVTETEQGLLLYNQQSGMVRVARLNNDQGEN